MIDPHKKARDADRDAAVEVVEAAFADGQITQADSDLRVDRLLRAGTLGEVQMLVQDLRRVEQDESVTEAVEQVTTDVPKRVVRVGAPQVNTRLLKLVLVVVGVVVALGAALPLGLLANVEQDGAVDSGVVDVGTEKLALTSADGYDALVSAVKRKTGSSMVFDATIYPGYAVVEVPVDGQSQRSFGYYYDGRWQEWTGSGTSSHDRFDLARVDGATVAALLRKVRRLVEDPTSSYVLMNARDDSAVCFSAYAINEFSETAYLDADCAGKVRFRYVS